MNTFDARTEKNLATLDQRAVPKFREFIQEARELAAQLGCEYVAISGNRTWKEQDALYAQGRTKPGNVVTNAKGGQSNHNFGIALDFAVFKGGKYLDESDPRTANRIHAAAGKIAHEYGLDWGGLWKTQDTPHFEIRTGISLAMKRERYKAKGSVLA